MADPFSDFTLPRTAQERLASLNQGAEGRKLWTSFLTVNELVLTKSAGITPIGHVTAAVVYNLGERYKLAKARKLLEDGEIFEWSETLRNAQRAVCARLQQCAVALSADGVLGVTLEYVARGLRKDHIQIKAHGTAVMFRAKPPMAQPCLSTFSIQDFARSLHAGYRPIGIVFGGCANYRHDPIFVVGTFYKSVEARQFVKCAADARRLAMQRLRDDARLLNACGVMGVSMQTSPVWKAFNSDDRPCYVVTQCTAIGTAVRSHWGDRPEVRYAVSLDDRNAPPFELPK